MNKIYYLGYEPDIKEKRAYPKHHYVCTCYPTWFFSPEQKIREEITCPGCKGTCKVEEFKNEKVEPKNQKHTL